MTRSTRPAERHGRTVVVPIDILDRLRPAAARRNVTVNELTRRILDAVGEDDLVDAVLEEETQA